MNVLRFFQGGGGITPKSFQWVEERPAGNTDQYWVRCDMRGDTILAVAYDGRVYSYNSGTWTEEQPAGDVNKNWTDCQIDAENGDFVVANTNRLFTKKSGTWAEEKPAGDADKHWHGVSINNGKLVAAWTNRSDEGRFYLYDSSWSQKYPAGGTDQIWGRCAINGSNILAAQARPSSSLGGYLYLSTNTGGSWARQDPAGISNRWGTASVKISGSKFLATWNARLYLKDGSGSWTALAPFGGVGTLPYTDCDIKGDKIIACSSIDRFNSNSGKVFYFDGTDWHLETPAGDVQKDWRCCSLSDRGMVVGSSAEGGGRLYAKLYR